MTSSRTSRALLGFLGVAILLVAWQILGATQTLGRTLPSFTEVLAVFGERGEILVAAHHAPDQAQFRCRRRLLGFTHGPDSAPRVTDCPDSD